MPLEKELKPLLKHMGFELLHIQTIPSSKLLRIYIDTPEGVQIGDCARVSHQISDMLNHMPSLQTSLQEYGFTTDYRLEVSSPGLDRLLTDPTHFQRYVGREIKVHCLAPKAVVKNEPMQGEPIWRRRFQGTLISSDDVAFVLQEQEFGVQIQIAYAEIAWVRLVPHWNFSSAKTT
jgi:ribosome maturation factor RimP